MAHFASVLGASFEDLIEKSGLTVELLDREDCIVEDGVYNSIVEECVDLTGDQYFGLHEGREKAPPEIDSYI